MALLRQASPALDVARHGGLGAVPDYLPSRCQALATTMSDGIGFVASPGTCQQHAPGSRLANATTCMMGNDLPPLGPVTRDSP